MSETEFIPCPICKPITEDEECAFTTVRRVEAGKTVIYCCTRQEKVNSGDKS